MKITKLYLNKIIVKIVKYHFSKAVVGIDIYEFWVFGRQLYFMVHNC